MCLHITCTYITKWAFKSRDANLRGRNVMVSVVVNPLLSRPHANTPIMHACE